MKNIFVGNLAFGTDEAVLRSAFERYGRVSTVQIVTDPITSRSRGFGFVRMPSLDDADEAVNRMSGADLQGRRLTVNLATETRRSPQQSSAGQLSAGQPSRSSALQLFEELRK